MGQKIKSLRVVIDTNLLLSALLFGGQPGKLHELWIEGKIVPLVSKETFAEFTRVLSYPKFRLSKAEISMIIEEEMLPYTEVVEIIEDIPATCRDRQDDKFLALAASGRAAYLITGDQDLLVLKTFGKTRIVTVLEMLGLIS